MPREDSRDGLKKPTYKPVNDVAESLDGSYSDINDNSNDDFDVDTKL